MVNNANEKGASTNIRVKLSTKKKLESHASEYGETHNDIIERLMRSDKFKGEVKAPNYMDKVER